MKKECLENVTLTRLNEDEDRGEHRVNFLTCLCNWITEQGLGGIVKKKKKNVAKFYKGRCEEL